MRSTTPPASGSEEWWSRDSRHLLEEPEVGEAPVRGARDVCKVVMRGLHAAAGTRSQHPVAQVGDVGLVVDAPGMQGVADLQRPGPVGLVLKDVRCNAHGAIRRRWKCTAFYKI